jgi:hypothetical protein
LASIQDEASLLQPSVNNGCIDLLAVALIVVPFFPPKSLFSEKAIATLDIFNELQLTHKKQSCLEINSFVRGDYSLKAVDFFTIKYFIVFR